MVHPYVSNTKEWYIGGLRRFPSFLYLYTIGVFRLTLVYILGLHASLCYYHGVLAGVTQVSRGKLNISNNAFVHLVVGLYFTAPSQLPLSVAFSIDIRTGIQHAGSSILLSIFTKRYVFCTCLLTILFTKHALPVICTKPLSFTRSFKRLRHLRSNRSLQTSRIDLQIHRSKQPLNAIHLPYL